MTRIGAPTLIAALLATSALLCSPPQAHAYCRTLSCTHELGVPGARCEPPLSDDPFALVGMGLAPECGGEPTAWRRSCVGFAVQSGASRQVSAKRAREIMRAAFDTWLGADCGNGTPGLRVEDLGEVDCDRVEYNETAGNANVLIFRDDSWPHDPREIAKATISRDTLTGEILDADIEINTTDGIIMVDIIPSSWQGHPCIGMDKSDACNEFDLQAVITHEVGHFLGLSHSPEPGATMAPNVRPFDSSVVGLAPDDVAGICAIYPPGAPIEQCNPIPKHGFSPRCGDQQTEGGDCSFAERRGQQRRSAWPSFALLAALALLVARRRPI